MNQLQIPRLGTTSIPRISPLYIPVMITESFGDMAERNMAEHQQRMQELASPRSWFDPWLNRMSRERYRNMYERTALTEIGGRIMGGAQGATLGFGLGSVIGAVVGAFVGGVGAVPGAATGGKIGASIGGALGFATSDYTTFHATNELVNNTIIETFRNPGRGLYNTLVGIGTTLDQANGAAFIKASLASLISGEDYWDKVADSYGFGDSGRTDMDFSEIRENLGINAGGVGNFFIDMLGEFATDPGFIGAVGKGVAKTSAKVIPLNALEAGTKNIDEVISKTSKTIVSLIDDHAATMKSVAKGDKVHKKFLKRITDAFLTDNVEDLHKVLVNNSKVAVNIEDVTSLMKHIRKESINNTSVKLFDLFKALDDADDFLTAKMFKYTSAPGLVVQGLKTYKWMDKHTVNLLGRFKYLFNGKKIDDIMELYTDASKSEVAEFMAKKSEDQMYEYNLLAKEIELKANDLEQVKKLKREFGLEGEPHKLKGLIDRENVIASEIEESLKKLNLRADVITQKRNETLLSSLKQTVGRLSKIASASKNINMPLTPKIQQELNRHVYTIFTIISNPDLSDDLIEFFRSKRLGNLFEFIKQNVGDETLKLVREQLQVSLPKIDEGLGVKSLEHYYNLVATFNEISKVDTMKFNARDFMKKTEYPMSRGFAYDEVNLHIAQLINNILDDRKKSIGLLIEKGEVSELHDIYSSELELLSSYASRSGKTRGQHASLRKAKQIANEVVEGFRSRKSDHLFYAIKGQSESITGTKFSSFPLFTLDDLTDSENGMISLLKSRIAELTPKYGSDHLIVKQQEQLLATLEDIAINDATLPKTGQSIASIYPNYVFNRSVTTLDDLKENYKAILKVEGYNKSGKLSSSQQSALIELELLDKTIKKQFSSEGDSVLNEMLAKTNALKKVILSRDDFDDVSYIEVIKNLSGTQFTEEEETILRLFKDGLDPDRTKLSRLGEMMNKKANARARQELSLKKSKEMLSEYHSNISKKAKPLSRTHEYAYKNLRTVPATPNRFNSFYSDEGLELIRANSDVEGSRIDKLLEKSKEALDKFTPEHGEVYKQRLRHYNSVLQIKNEFDKNKFILEDIINDIKISRELNNKIHFDEVNLTKLDKELDELDEGIKLEQKEIDKIVSKNQAARDEVIKIRDKAMSHLFDSIEADINKRGWQEFFSYNPTSADITSNQIKVLSEELKALESEYRVYALKVKEKEAITKRITELKNANEYIRRKISSNAIDSEELNQLIVISNDYTIELNDQAAKLKRLDAELKDPTLVASVQKYVDKKELVDKLKTTAPSIKPKLTALAEYIGSFKDLKGIDPDIAVGIVAKSAVTSLLSDLWVYGKKGSLAELLNDLSNSMDGNTATQKFIDEVSRLAQTLAALDIGEVDFTKAITDRTVKFLDDLFAGSTFKTADEIHDIAEEYAKEMSKLIRQNDKHFLMTYHHIIQPNVVSSGAKTILDYDAILFDAKNYKVTIDDDKFAMMLPREQEILLEIINQMNNESVSYSAFSAFLDGISLNTTKTLEEMKENIYLNATTHFLQMFDANGGVLPQLIKDNQLNKVGVTVRAKKPSEATVVSDIVLSDPSINKVVFDLESNKQFFGLPIQIAGVDSQGRKVELFLDPDSIPDFKMDEGAIEVHKLSIEDLRSKANKVSLDVMVKQFAEFVKDGVLVGHNVSYDLKTLISSIAFLKGVSLVQDGMDEKIAWDTLLETHAKEIDTWLEEYGLNLDYVDTEKIIAAYAHSMGLDASLKGTSNTMSAVRLGTAGYARKTSKGIYLDIKGNLITSLEDYMKANNFNKVIVDSVNDFGKRTTNVVEIGVLDSKTHDAMTDITITNEILNAMLEKDVIKGKRLSELDNLDSAVNIKAMLNTPEKQKLVDDFFYNLRQIKDLEGIKDIDTSVKSGAYNEVDIVENINEIHNLVSNVKSIQDLNVNDLYLVLGHAEEIRDSLNSMASGLSSIGSLDGPANRVIQLEEYASQMDEFIYEVDEAIRKYEATLNAIYPDLGRLRLNTAYVSLRLSNAFVYNDSFKLLNWLFTGEMSDLTEEYLEGHSNLKLFREVFARLETLNIENNLGELISFRSLPGYVNLKDMFDTFKAVTEGQNFYLGHLKELDDLLSSTLFKYDEAGGLKILDNTAFDTLHQMYDKANELIKYVSDNRKSPEYLEAKLTATLEQISRKYSQEGLENASDMGAQIYANIIKSIVARTVDTFTNGGKEVLYNIDAKLSTKLYHQVKSNLMNIVEYALPMENVPVEIAIRNASIRGSVEFVFKDLVDSIRRPLTDVKNESKELQKLGYIRESDIRQLTGKYTRENIASNVPETFIGLQAYKDSQERKRLWNLIFNGITEKKRQEPGKYIEFLKLSASEIIQKLSDITGVEDINLLKITGNLTKRNDYDNYLVSLYYEILADPNKYSNFIDVNQLQVIEDLISTFDPKYVHNIEELQRRLRTLVITNIMDYDGMGKLTKEINGETLTDILKKPSQTLDNATNITVRAMKEAGSFELTTRVLDSFKNTATGGYHYELLSSFLKSNPDLRLVVEVPRKVVNKNTGDEAFGVLRQIDTNNIELLQEVLTNKENYNISFMSYDNFLAVSNKIEPVQLPKFAEVIRKILVTPLKILSLVNLPFLINNFFEGITKNSLESGNPIGAINDIVFASKDFHTYQKYYLKLMGDYDLYKKYRDVDLLSEFWIDELANNWAKYGNGEKLDMDLIDQLRRFEDFTKTQASSFELNEFKRNVMIARKRESDYKELFEKHQKGELLNEEDEVRFYIINNEPTKGFDSIEQEIEYLNVQIKGNRATRKQYQRYFNLTAESDALDNALRKVYNTFIFQAMQKSLSLSSTFETIGRYAMYNRTIMDGGTVSEAAEKLRQWYFIYSNKSAAEKYAEFLVPFITYPMKTAELFYTQMQDSKMFKFVEEFTKQSWGDREYENSDYLLNRKMSGDFLLNETTGVKIGMPFYDALNFLGNPLEAFDNKLNPLMKPILDLARNSEYNRWTGIPIISQGRNFLEMYKGIQDGGLKTNPIATIFPSVTNEYFKQQTYNHHRGRIYPRSNYKDLYTRAGYSRQQMRMQNTTGKNLPYRINDIMYSFRRLHGN